MPPQPTLPPPPTPIAEFFTSTDGLRRLADLRDQYRQSRPAFLAALRKFLQGLYALSDPYVGVINDAFYSPDLPDDAVADPRRNALSVPDRERCLIALLAARGEPWALATHVYVGLMEGISPEEIAHIIFLAGIYSGVSNFIGGIETEGATLSLLEDTNTPLEPITIAGMILAKFRAPGS